jgi:ATP-dependent Clp endopeptidase proteolytic subunit ClpP
MGTHKKIPKLKIDIRNQSEDVAEIDIDGEIGWVNENGEWNTAANIKDKLKEIDEIDASKIVVNINSLGGFVDDGLAIHDVLAQHEAEIETRVIGMTASAATIIAQAGDKRFMSDNSLYLIHKAWGLVIGNANDMLAQAEDLEAIDSRILNIYAKRSSKTESELQELMNENEGAGKWIDADEALEFGLIDEAFEPMKAAAAVDRGAFNKMGLPEPKDYDFMNVESKQDVTIQIDGDYIKNALEHYKNFTERNENDETQEAARGEGNLDILQRRLTLIKNEAYL